MLSRLQNVQNLHLVVRCLVGTLSLEGRSDYSDKALRYAVLHLVNLASLIRQMKVGGVRYTMEDDGGIIDINTEGPNIIR